MWQRKICMCLHIPSLTPLHDWLRPGIISHIVPFPRKAASGQDICHSNRNESRTMQSFNLLTLFFPLCWAWYRFHELWPYSTLNLVALHFSPRPLLVSFVFLDSFCLYFPVIWKCTTLCICCYLRISLRFDFCRLSQGPPQGLVSPAQDRDLPHLQFQVCSSRI